MSNIINKWSKADCVCFDVDSTLIEEESINELAKFKNVGDVIHAMTNNAMNGAMLFQDTLKARLSLMKPSLSDFENFNQEHTAVLTKGMRSLINLLHSRRVQVYLITGGFHRIVDSIAQSLNIPLENVFANTVIFTPEGEYLDVDWTQPSSRSGGKQEICGLLKDKFHYECLVMVGDGVTDMETLPVADAFIGFGANVVREGVRGGSDWFVTCTEELMRPLEKR